MQTSSLRSGTKLVTDDGMVYQLERVIGQGGFGTAYAGHRVSKSGRRARAVCIKICRSRKDWHGEAFFGELLNASPRVVSLLDAFVDIAGSGSRQQRRHVLVFEYMADGTVWDSCERGTAPWSEAKVRRELKTLLAVLARLHNAGVTHRDLKPDNVFLRDGKIVLGDFGITKMDLDPRHSFVSAFAPEFAPKEVLTNFRWGQADDVYQIGLLAGTLACGKVWSTETVSAKSISALRVSDAFKSWIWHATGAKAKRYLDAADALDALDALLQIDLRPGRLPRSLKGETLVFTGRIGDLRRVTATELARRVGARVQAGVTDDTTLVVMGKINEGSAAGAVEGRKLFAVRERLRLGQEIRILDDSQFKRLIERPG